MPSPPSKLSSNQKRRSSERKESPRRSQSSAHLASGVGGQHHDSGVKSYNAGSKYIAHRGGKISISYGAHLSFAGSKEGARVSALEKHFEEFNVSSLYYIRCVHIRQLEGGGNIAYFHGHVGQDPKMTTFAVFDHEISHQQWEKYLSWHLQAKGDFGLTNHVAQMWGFSRAPGLTAIVFRGVLAPVFIPVLHKIHTYDEPEKHFRAEFTTTPSQCAGLSMHNAFSSPVLLPDQWSISAQHSAMMNYFSEGNEIHMAQIFVQTENWRLVIADIEAVSLQGICLGN